MQDRRDWLAALALAALFAFTGLGNHPLRAADEPRVAGIAWEAQHEGRWLVPHLGGEPFLEHPPLYYAVTGASIRALGATDTAARLPAALASFATLLLVYSLGRRLADRAAGFAALLMLVCTAAFARYSHRTLVDPMLMGFATLGVYAYVRAVWPARRAAADALDARVSSGWLLAVYAAAALAFWTKGFVGVVVVGGPPAFDVLLARRWRVLGSPAHLLGAPLLLAACAAWPLLLRQFAGEAAFREFVVHNGLYRVVPSLGEGAYKGGHQHGFAYYLPRIPQVLGGALAVVPALAAWLRRGRTPPGWNLAALRFLAWVFPIGVLLLSFPGTKRSLYLLPFAPALAVPLGAWLSAARRDDPLRSRVEAGTLALCAWVAGGFGLRAPRLREAWQRVVGGSDGRIAARGSDGPLRLAAVGFALSLAWNVVGLPFTGQDRDLEPLARTVDARVGDGHLAGVALEESVRGALAFYAGRFATLVPHPDGIAHALEGGEVSYLLAPDGIQAEVQQALAGRIRSRESLLAAEGDLYGLYGLAGSDPTAARR